MSDEKFVDMVSSELQKIVISTLSDLKPKYRQILVMRCYEEMEYSEIAEKMGCSEFAARVLFFRAKKRLHKVLSKKGLNL